MKWPRLIEIVVLILAVIVVAVIVIWPSMLGREIDSQIAAIKAKGDPVRFADLAPKAVPNTQNAALIYERIFAVTEPGKQGIDNSFDVLSPSKLNGHPEVLVTVRQTVAKYRSVIPLTEQAVTRPQCRFNIDWNVAPEQVKFTPYAKLRRLSKLISEIAVIDAMNGKIDGSVKVLDLDYRISESLNHEPTLIGYLVHCACARNASRAMLSSAQYGDIPEPQARKLFDLLGKIDLRSCYARAMKGERVTGLNMIERTGNGDSDYITRTLSRTLAYVDASFWLKHMSKVIRDADKPCSAMHSPNMGDKSYIPSYACISTALLPVFSKAKIKTCEAMSTVEGDRNFLAVLAYKSKFGSYPSSLQDVEKKLGWKLPPDPLAGGPYHYRREGKGFVLYGLGKNMKDDQARTFQDPPKPRGIPGPPGSPSSRYFAFLNKYPYTNGDGRHSADMIWRKDT